MMADRQMRASVCCNIIYVFSCKLNNYHVGLRVYQFEHDRFLGQLSVLKRQLDQQEVCTSDAVDIAAKYGDLSEYEMEMNGQVKDLVPRILVDDDEPEFRRLVVKTVDLDISCASRKMPNRLPTSSARRR